MATKAENASSPLDTVLLFAAVAILIGGIVGYYQLEEQSVLLGALTVVGSVIVALFVASRSAIGQQLWHFVLGSRVELRKVVWPTRQETLQTTGLVFLFALVLGLFFWGLDAFLLWVVTSLTN